MQKGDYLNSILRSSKTIFTLKDIALIWQEKNTNAVIVRLNYYVKQGDLIRIRRGVYTKDKNYNKLELATRIFTPSYISFETVLSKEGLIFQYQTGITAATYLTRSLTIDNQTYIYKKLKNKVLLNNSEVNLQNNISTASKERAFLDTLYINTNYHFDNLRSIDWKVIKTLLPLYDNKRLNAKVKNLAKKT